MWGYSTKPNKPQMLRTWLIPFGFTRFVKFELFGSKCFLKYYCRTFYNASFFLNEFDLSPKTLFLHIFSLLVCVLLSSFVLLNLPLHGLPCSPFMQLLGSFKLLFSLSNFLVMELISFVWSIGDCSFPYSFLLHPSGNSCLKASWLAFHL